ncbi:MAG: cupin domain-containing protein [Aureliella sp.]
MHNLLKNLPADLTQEVVEVLAEGKNVRIERIVSHGQASPADFWYDQAQAEWVAVIQGEARVLFEGDDAPVHLRAGDYLTIAAHRRHRVAWTKPDEPTIWLAVFFEER